MKHNMIAFIALLTMATFAGAVMAQTPERPAAPAVTDKPSVSAAEKPKTEELKVEKKEAPRRQEFREPEQPCSKDIS